MRQIITPLVFMAFLAVLGGCSMEENHVISLVQVEPCPDVKMEHIVNDMSGLDATVKEKTFWIAPATNLRGEDPVEKVPVKLWLLIPDDHPTWMVMPCNLPDEFKEPLMRVHFYADELHPVRNPTSVNGVIVANLREIGQIDEGC